MVVQCEEVWREVSDYVDGELGPELRAAIDEHLHGCKRCTAVLDGTRNVVSLYSDERMFEVPLGFSSRLQHRLEETMPRRRGSVLGWAVAFALAALVLVSFEAGRSAAWRWPSLRSKLAQPAHSIPPDLAVVVSDDGRVFNIPGCRYIHDKTHVRSMVAGEALKGGYSPCIRCMRKYLSAGVIAGLALSRGEDAIADLDAAGDE